MNLSKAVVKFLSLLAASIYIYHAGMVECAIVLFAVLAMFYMSGYDYKTIWQQLRMIRIFLLFLFIVDSLTLGLFPAALCVIRVEILYLLAALISITTPISVTMVMFEKLLLPLRLFRINVQAFALLFAMSLRFIPLIGLLIQQIKEAQKARGVERNMVSLLQASFVNILKMQNQIADAIEARGFSLED